MRFSVGKRWEKVAAVAPGMVNPAQSSHGLNGKCFPGLRGSVPAVNSSLLSYS